jgi:hypothetical protein
MIVISIIIIIITITICGFIGRDSGYVVSEWWIGNASSAFIIIIIIIIIIITGRGSWRRGVLLKTTDVAGA